MTMGVRRHPCSNVLSLYISVLPAAKHGGRLKDLLSGKVLPDTCVWSCRQGQLELQSLTCGVPSAEKLGTGRSASLGPDDRNGMGTKSYVLT